MKQKIAFISLIPDAGHVLPLLRLADSLRRQYDVRCFFPDECQQITAQFNIPVSYFGKVTTSADKEILQKISKRSIFYNAFSYYVDVILAYLNPISLAGAIQIRTILNLIKCFNPDLMIVDNHLLKDFFIRIAEELDKKIIFHESGGNYRYCEVFDKIDPKKALIVNNQCFRFISKQFLFIYGFITVHPLLQSIVIFLGRRLTAHSWTRTKNETKKVENMLDDLLKKSFCWQGASGIKPMVISTGIPFLEEEITRSKFVGESIRKNLFPPLKDSRHLVIDDSLHRWLEEAGERPIVYICLGTMVHGNKKIIRKIIDGLRNLDIYILWVAPLNQIELIKEVSDLPNLRTEEYLPQPQILSLEKIRCFITHAGAGSIQDGLMNGKPMLCIPFMFDQAFNSSIIELLQVGIKIWKNKLTAQKIQQTVDILLRDSKYAKAAANIKNKLESLDSSEAIIRVFKENAIL